MGNNVEYVTKKNKATGALDYAVPLWTTDGFMHRYNPGVPDSHINLADMPFMYCMYDPKRPAIGLLLCGVGAVPGKEYCAGRHQGNAK